jgi:hypothetical protein
VPDLANLVIKIDSNGVATASRSLNEMTLAGQKAESATSQLKKQIGEMIAAAAAIAGTVKIVKELTEAFQEGERSSAGLANAFRATGQNANSRAIEDYAVQLAKVTEYGHDASIEAARLLVQMAGLTENGVRKALPAVQDLAAALGMDLSSAAQLVAKAMSDNEGALSRYGIKVVEGATKADTFNNVLDAIEKNLNGTALAMGETASGRAKQLEDALDELKESGGDLIDDFLTPAVHGLTAIIEKLSAVTSGWATFENTLRSHKLSTSIEGLEDQKKALEDYLRLYNQDTMPSGLKELGERILFNVKQALTGRGFADVFANTPAEVAKLLEEINKALYWEKQKLASGGLTLPDILGGESPSGGTGKPVKSVRLTPQEWFEKVTGVPEGTFSNAAAWGQKAASEYVDGMVREFSSQEQVSTMFGTAFDPLPYLESQRDTISKALVDLLSVPESQITEPFTTADDSIKALIQRLKELDVAILTKQEATLGGGPEAPSVLYSPSAATPTATDWGEYFGIDTFDQDDLGTVKDIVGWINRIREASGALAADNSLAAWLTTTGSSLTAFASDCEVAGAKVEESFRDIDMFDQDDLGILKTKTKEYQGALKGLHDELEQIGLLDLANGLENLFSDAAISALEAVGEALYKGADGAESLRESLGNIALELLNALPQLYLSAGLNLLASNPSMWPLALGLIAASGIAALASGYANAYVSGGESEEATSTETSGSGSAVAAKALTSYATSATRSAGAMLLNVTITNYSGEKVETQESTAPDGTKQLEVIVGSIVTKKIASGALDKALAASYGLSRKGQRL